MSRTIEFLDTLSDHELAYFAKFKLSTYMFETQHEIKKYIDSRKLHPQTIDKLTTKKVDTTKNAVCCPRCGSNKWLINNVEWTETFGKSGREDDIAASDGLWYGKATYKDEIICIVCDFWLQDPNKKAPKGNSKKKVTIWNFVSSIFDNL